MKIIRRNVFRFEMGHDGCTINENVKTDSKFVQHFSVKKEEEKNKLKKIIPVFTYFGTFADIFTRIINF